jgi:hypothetical protein
MTARNPPNAIAVRDQMVPVGDGRSFFEGLREIGVATVELHVAPDLSVPHLTGDPACRRSRWQARRRFRRCASALTRKAFTYRP